MRARRTAGHCLETDPVNARAIKAQIDTLEGYASNNANRKTRIVNDMKAKLERSITDASTKLADRLERQVRDAIETHSADHPAWLASFIERVVYAGLPTAAGYLEFQARVLQALRCPATGRFAVSPLRP
jgi:hypothetical protein